MTEDNVTFLKNRIQKLESNLDEKCKEIDVLKAELAIANHRLSGIISHLKDEIKVATCIQKTLIPTELPKIPDFEFSTKFISSPKSGSDYYEIFEHRDKFCFAILLASSSNYVTSAKLMSAILKWNQKLRTARRSEPQEPMQEMLTELKDDLDDGEFIDLFYGVVDRRNFQLSYRCFGSLLGFHWSASRKEWDLFPPNDPTLSSDSPIDLPPKSLFLNPKDQIILGTRGLIEVQNEQGEGFGKDLFFKSVLEAPPGGVHDVRNSLLYCLEKHKHNEHSLPRDMTLIVSQVKDKVLKLANPKS